MLQVCHSPPKKNLSFYDLYLNLAQVLTSSSYVLYSLYSHFSLPYLRIKMVLIYLKYSGIFPSNKYHYQYIFSLLPLECILFKTSDFNLCKISGHLLWFFTPFGLIGINFIPFSLNMILFYKEERLKFIYLFIFWVFFRAAPVAYGGSQARGWIGAVAASLLCHSHSNPGSEPRLQPTLKAHGNTGSLTHWLRPGSEPTSSWILVGFVNCWARMGTLRCVNFKYINLGE